MLETKLTLPLQYKDRPCLLLNFSQTVPTIIGDARSSPKKDQGDFPLWCIDTRQLSVPEIFLPRSTCHRGLPKSLWRELMGKAKMKGEGGTVRNTAQKQDAKHGLWWEGPNRWVWGSLLMLSPANQRSWPVPMPDCFCGHVLFSYFLCSAVALWGCFYISVLYVAVGKVRF